PTSSGTEVPVAALVAAGFLDEGETLISTRASVPKKVAVLADDRLEHEDQIFGSPSAAAAYCAGTAAENGWTFWMADRDGELVSLKDIRTQYLGAAREGRDTDRHRGRYGYWSSLLELARERTQLHARVSPTKEAWIAAGAGYSGVHFMYEIRRHDGGVHLYLEHASAAVNHGIFEALARDRAAIEERFGGPLSWDAKPGRKRCSIGLLLSGGYADDVAEWPNTQSQMVDAMIRLADTLTPHLASAVASART
ncbi:MAG: DUF4268 domain-containing protein, partial [Solirubrobacteraceae bacterium]